MGKNGMYLNENRLFFIFKLHVLSFAVFDIDD